MRPKKYKHPTKLPISKRKKALSLLSIAGLIFLWLTAVMLYQTNKPLPPGVSYESPIYTTQEIKFWYDLTYPDPLQEGEIIQEQLILPRIIEIIEESREFLVIDLFLFNDYTHTDSQFPKLARQLTDTLIAQKRHYPNMNIVFITDKVNTNYSSAPNALLEDMKAAGISVIMTNVDPLRDSTPLYSSIWRTFFQWFGQSGSGWIPNLMASAGPDITLRSYLELLNVKANHRKLVVSEQTALISSANIHDASAYHSNIAFEVSGDIIADILATEQAVVNFSGGGQLPAYTPSGQAASSPNSIQSAQIRYVTEGKIHKHVLQEIKQTDVGDTLWMGMFYLADDQVIQELLSAADRGADIRLILDPNQNAFGQDKIGIPNRPAAAELHADSNGTITIRWYNTTEEQFHTKLMFIEHAEGDTVVIGGSANFTPRNLNDYNLENNLWVSAPADHPFTKDISAYFQRLWSNDGADYTLELEAYQENSTWLKYTLYRLQKILGFTTF